MSEEDLTTAYMVGYHKRDDEVAALKVEIERLREEKVALISAKEVTITPPALPEGFVIDELRKTIVALHADIARIREEGQKDYDGMREFQWKFIDASHEIERLRGERDEARKMLRESVEEEWWRKPDFKNRVREALGDKP